MDGVPSSRGYRGGFASRLMAKDLGLVKTAAEHCGAPVPLTEEAQRWGGWVGLGCRDTRVEADRFWVAYQVTVHQGGCGGGRRALLHSSLAARPAFVPA